MKDISIITKALQKLLQDDVNLKQFEVTRNEYVNTDPGRSKWIGIYKGKVEHSAKYLMAGAPASYQTKFVLSVVVQAFSGMHKGEDTDEELEQRIKTVTDRVMDGTKIGGTVQNITGVYVEYQYDESDDSTMPFQIAIISIHVENKG